MALKMHILMYTIMYKIIRRHICDTTWGFTGDLVFLMIISKNGVLS